jgi:hypothetical protein
MNPEQQLAKRRGKGKSSSDINRTEEAPRHHDMRIELRPVCDIANGQEVKLLQLPAASAMDGKEDGPGKAHAGEADDTKNPEEAEKEETIQ